MGVFFCSSVGMPRMLGRRVATVNRAAKRRFVRMDVASSPYDLKLEDTSLMRTTSFVDGSFCEEGAAGSASWFEVRNPANGEVVSRVLEAGSRETKLAVDAASRAWEGWRTTSGKERAMVLRRWFDLLVENKKDIALLMTLEQGKPRTEAMAEVQYAADFVDWFSAEARRIKGDFVTSGSSQRGLVLRQPVGVCAAITPWNFPAAMVTRKAAAALAAGCTMVCKPSELTPLTALALATLAERAGVPRGVLNIICGTNAKEIGLELTSNPLVRKITFTGSTQVGKLLMAQASATVKRMSMELGGHAPFIVMDDADIDTAVKALMSNKFRNAGQTCISANRVYVQRQVLTEFVGRLKLQISGLRIGAGWEEGVNVGPLINSMVVQKVEAHVSDAVGKGARVECGGKPLPELGNNFYSPTLLTNVQDSCLIACEETFGPVAAVFCFDSEEEVIDRANHTKFGLASYLFTSDLSRGLRMSEKLEYGMVGLNESMISDVAMPFGGVKESGIGREGSIYGLEDYEELKYVCIGNLA